MHNSLFFDKQFCRCCQTLQICQNGVGCIILQVCSAPLITVSPHRLTNTDLGLPLQNLVSRIRKGSNYFLHPLSIGEALDDDDESILLSELSSDNHHITCNHNSPSVLYCIVQRGQYSTVSIVLPVSWQLKRFRKRRIVQCAARAPCNLK